MLSAITVHLEVKDIVEIGGANLIDCARSVLVAGARNHTVRHRRVI
jgi:hypothetical protein